MGILDKKSRIMDVIVTPEGRRQMHSGDFRAEFVSFSDRSAYYSSDSTTGSIAEDASNRLYLEAKQLSSDKIIFEVDSDGQLLGSDIDPNVKFFGEGGILQRETELSQLTSGAPLFKKIPDDKFIGIAEGLSTGSLDNFKKLKIIGSVNSNKFNMELPDNKVTFTIDNFIPFSKLPIRAVEKLENIPPIVHNPNFNHINQFKFLPPVNIDNSSFGNYVDNGSDATLTFKDIINKVGYLPEDEIGGLEALSGYRSNFLKKFDNQPTKQDIENIDTATYSNNNTTQKKSFIFRETNFSSNLLTQIFEINDEELSFDKLKIVDAGEFLDEDDTKRQMKRVFYAGKVFKDKFGVNIFVNMFTLIFD